MSDKLREPILTDVGQPFVDSRGLLTWEFNEAVNSMVRNYLTRMYGTSPEMDDKIEAAYNEYTGGDFTTLRINADRGNAKPASFFLHGSPGHGKTACSRVAGHIICDLLDLNFIEDFPKDYIPHPKDYVFVSQQMSGEPSALMLGGTPQVSTMKFNDPDTGEEIDAAQYMSKNLQYRFRVLQQANFGTCILDDISNCPEKLQNIMLSLLQRCGFQAINFGSGINFVATGNLGSADGTYTHKMSAAVGNRAINFVMSADAVRDTVPYLMKKFNTLPLTPDEVATMDPMRVKELQHRHYVPDHGMSAYLTYIQKCTNKNPYDKPRKEAANCNPRTVEALVEGSFLALQAKFRGLSGKPESNEKVAEYRAEIRNLCGSIMGYNHSDTMADFIQGYFTEALPLAKEMINRAANPDKEAVKDDTQDMSAPQLMKWDMQMAEALSQAYIEKILFSEDLKGMPEEERDMIHFRVSQRVAGMTQTAKNYFMARIQNTVPAVFDQRRNSMNISPEMKEQLIESRDAGMKKLIVVASGEFEDPRLNKAGKEKVQSKELGA